MPHIDQYEKNTKIKNEEIKNKIKLNSQDLANLVTNFKELDKYVFNLMEKILLYSNFEVSEEYKNLNSS